MAERFHRGDEELFTDSEWGGALRVDARVALALGSAPLEDARRRLPPVAVPSVRRENEAPADGPNDGLEFVVDVRAPPGGMPASAAQTIFSSDVRARLDFPRVWAASQSAHGAAIWALLHETPPDARILALAVCWELTGLLTLTPQDTSRELRRYVRDADAVAKALGLAGAQPRTEPDEAAARAARLLALRRRYGRGVEMRLVPTQAPFAARDVWRAAYSLGLEWGDLDLFHWNDATTGTRLFTLSALGQPGYFLPERAAEGQRIAAGIAIGFELPTCPAPVAVYDRLALALLYLYEKLGGRPAAPNGADLDADRLDEGRGALAEAVTEMERAGIAPGSPQAARFF